MTVAEAARERVRGRIREAGTGGRLALDDGEIAEALLLQAVPEMVDEDRVGVVVVRALRCRPDVGLDGDRGRAGERLEDGGEARGLQDPVETVDPLVRIRVLGRRRRLA
jgi:hypothetical protein